MTSGRVNPNFRLEDQGIDGLGNVYYNLIEPALIEAALKTAKATRASGGAFLVTTGKFTGRSPKDKHVVKTDSVADTIWWENNAAMSPEAFDALYDDMLAHMKGRDYFVQDLSAAPTRPCDQCAHGDRTGLARAVHPPPAAPSRPRRAGRASSPISPSSTAPASRPTRPSTTAAPKP